MAQLSQIEQSADVLHADSLTEPSVGQKGKQNKKMRNKVTSGKSEMKYQNNVRVYKDSTIRYSSR
jgi:hypothetical protein